MAKIGISDFYPIDIGMFLHDLTPAQLKKVLGGFPYVYIENISDAINDHSFTSEVHTFHDNRIDSRDYSRSNYTFGTSWVNPWFH
ncbi:MAG: hypothetical protein KME21_31065 [Desmonostoc vinosum HA7617-LM4]|jgi:hypothetical protein|nr:hypothetical protein [Desmonostoc vinosum HA7617-LM4]